MLERVRERDFWMHDHYDILKSIVSSPGGWFAFFEDEGTAKESEPDEAITMSYWAEPIVAWGTYDVYYPGEEDLNGVEVYGMRVESTVGQLTNDFVDAENFIGIMFSKILRDTAGSDLVTMEEIQADPGILRRLVDITLTRRMMKEQDLRDIESLGNYNTTTGSDSNNTDSNNELN